jgi:uncharacterized protein YdeI (YjbR/CyaY-like superfamily)
MPYGEGKLFLPVKAAIRKKIGKEAGDYVHVVLYPDNAPTVLPRELLLCRQDEPEALRFFNALADAEQEKLIKWIYSAKTQDAKIDRIAKAIDSLGRRSTFQGQLRASLD